MGEATQSKQNICVFCKAPITKGQRPTVLLQPGKESHIECWIKQRKEAGKPN